MVQGSQTILRWLDEEGVAGADRDEVIDQACLHLARTDQATEDEKQDILRNLLFDEAASQSRHGSTVADRERSVVWSALRLALWILPRISDVRVRARAFALASRELARS